VRTVRSISFCDAIDSGLLSCEYRKSPCGSSLVTISSKP
jgi:hypothetical protein